MLIKGGRSLTGEYPQLIKDQKMLRFLHERIEEAWDQGETQIMLAYYGGEGRAGLFVYEGHVDVGEKIGVRGAEAVSMFKRLGRAGYVLSDVEHHADNGVTNFRGLSNQGLAEICVLPDPRERLLSGLEIALRNVEQDPTLRPEEKEEKLNAGREAIAFTRGLAVEVAAKVLVGG